MIDLETFYPGEGPVRAGDGAQQPARLARLRAPGWKASRSTSARCCTRPTGKPRIAIFSIAHLERRRADVLRHAAAQRDARLDADAVGHHQPARDALHGRDLRLLPAGGESAVEAADADAAQAGARVRPGVVLATQNPVDLDYKGLSNAGTWFIGRLQTERDKRALLDGLEGAAASGAASSIAARWSRSSPGSATACS